MLLDDLVEKGMQRGIDQTFDIMARDGKVGLGQSHFNIRNEC